MMLHQVEFLVEGHMLPPTIGRLKISETLILEQVYRSGSEHPISAIAYVGVVTPGEANPFFTARDYLDFFLLIYCLVSGQAVTTTMGIGTTLDDINSLGRKRVGFPGSEKIEVMGEYEEDFVSKPILEAKKRFLLFEPDRQKIMESPLGLALKYYYLAVRASSRLSEEAVIHLMIAAEALLITMNEKVRGTLSSRLSTLIAENETEKAEISKKMRELYDLRSAIVHGKGKKTSFDEARILFAYVRRAIECGLSLRRLTKEELAAKLDNECAQNDGA